MSGVHVDSRGSKREKSKNELIIISGVKLPEYYNKFVVPLSAQTRRKFEPMSDSRNTGLCPFHLDTDPSFHWWKAKNIFHCFGCGVGGDVVTIHQRLQRAYYGANLSIEKAVEQLALEFGLELDEEEGHIVKSVFERAKELLFDKKAYHIPKGQFSLTEYRQLNNKVKSVNMPVNIKIQNFEHLDLVASLATSNHK